MIVMDGINPPRVMVMVINPPRPPCQMRGAAGGARKPATPGAKLLEQV
jgi:hypothetical protein